MERPQTQMRKPQILYIVGCEGINQEKKYFDKIQKIINTIPSRKCDILFDIAPPFGGNPCSIVERTVTRSIGKTNKVAVFDFDGQTVKYEEALDLAKINKIEVGNTNYCFDLWLILHKEDYYAPVSHQNNYAVDVKRIFGLPRNADIKKASNVDNIMNQIELIDIIAAIKRAESIEATNIGKPPCITPNQKIKYYNNPDTQMHTILKSIFKKVGINI